MIGISDLALESFDISNRDAPTKTGELALANNVTGMAIAGDLLVRLSADWWSSDTVLEIADAADPESPTALGRLDLDAVVPKEGASDAEFGCWYYSWYDPEIFVRAGFVYLVRSLWRYDGDESIAIDVVDIRDPFAPAYVRTLELPFGRGWSYGPHLTNDQQSIVLVEDALVFSSVHTDWYDGEYAESTGAFEIVDLADPGNPVHAQSFERPAALAHGGLQVFDGTVVSWHMRAANSAATKVRFFLDRVYVPSAAHARASASVNVPGAVVAWDDRSKRAVVVDYQFENARLPDDECWQHARGAWTYDPVTGDGTCRLVRRDLHLVRVEDRGAFLLDTVRLEDDESAVRGAAASDDRLFVHLQRGDWAWDEDGGYESLPTAEISVFADWQGSTLGVAATAEIPGDNNWLSDLQALGSRLVFRANNGLGEVNATDPAAPVVDVHDLYGYYCYDLDADAERAYCAMGQWGLQAVELGG